MITGSEIGVAGISVDRRAEVRGAEGFVRPEDARLRGAAARFEARRTRRRIVGLRLAPGRAEEDRRAADVDVVLRVSREVGDR
jgi:hypothetical protein